MNACMETILKRRSIRSFLDKAIPQEQLDDILKAAIYAPSAKNLQTWKFTAVCNRSLIQKLAKVIEKELDRTGYDMYQPEVLIIPSNDRNSPYGKEDNACALENMFLAAASYGIGSVWINQLQDISDRPSVRSVLDELEIPSDHVVYGMAALGYAAREAAEPARKGTVHIIR